MFSIKNIIAVDTEFQEDKKLAYYLDFLATKSPIEKIVHLHILKSTSYALHKKVVKMLKETLEKERMLPLLETYKNIEKLSGLVSSEKLIPTLKTLCLEQKATLIAVSKAAHSLHTVKNIIRHLACNILVIPKNTTHKFQTILVPVDLSEHSGKLLETAIALQQQSVYKLKIICYHAYEIPDVPYYNVLRTEKQMHIETQEIVREAFNAFISKHNVKEANIIPVLYEEPNNWPSHYILNYIKEHSIDFVIMGTQNHGTFSGWMGSTVEKVVSKNDSCPILIVK